MSSEHTEGQHTDGSSTAAPAVRTVELTKWYGSVRALSGVNFEISRGEVVALVGDNGAGKSTFVKMLAGDILPTSGEIHVDGEPVQLHEPGDARKLGIETVYQDLALVNHVDVGGNLYLGREPTRGGLLGRLSGVLDQRRMARRADAALDELHVSVPSVRSPVGTMSGGQRQAVAIARTVYWGTKLLILDEPTAALGVKESTEALHLIERVAEKGIPLIVISHNIEHVLQIATRVCVMRHGELVADLDRDETTGDEIVGYITGSNVGMGTAESV